MQALHFYYAYWKFYNECTRSLFAERIPCNQFSIIVGHLVYQHRRLIVKCVELIQPSLVHPNTLAGQLPKYGEKEPGFVSNLDVYTFCVQREIIKRVACMHGQVNRAPHVPQEVEHKELTLLHQAVLVKFVPQQRLVTNNGVLTASKLVTVVCAIVQAITLQITFDTISILALEFTHNART